MDLRFSRKAEADISGNEAPARNGIILPCNVFSTDRVSGLFLYPHNGWGVVVGMVLRILFNRVDTGIVELLLFAI